MRFISWLSLTLMIFLFCWTPLDFHSSSTSLTALFLIAGRLPLQQTSCRHLWLSIVLCTKQNIYNLCCRIESSARFCNLKSINQQHTSRAGRTQSGKCFQLYTEKSFKTRVVQQTHQEILQFNLSLIERSSIW